MKRRVDALGVAVWVCTCLHLVKYGSDRPNPDAHARLERGSCWHAGGGVVATEGGGVFTCLFMPNDVVRGTGVHAERATACKTANAGNSPTYEVSLILPFSVGAEPCFKIAPGGVFSFLAGPCAQTRVRTFDPGSLRMFV